MRPPAPCCPLIAGLLWPLLVVAALSAQPSDGLFEPGDRVALVGNTFAERLRLDGHFESALLASLPDHDLVVRNLAWSADEVDLRPRPLNFGPVAEHLENLDIDIALLFYGANEAFAGAEGLADFAAGLRRYLEALSLVPTDGGTLRTVLVSPIARESHPRFARLPDAEEANRGLGLYVDAMREVAAERGVPFVDIFEASQRAFEASEEPLTFNSLHLTDEGNRVMARALVEAMGYRDPSTAVFARSRAGDIEIDRLPTGARIVLATPMAADFDPDARLSLFESENEIASATAREWLAGVVVDSEVLARAGEALRTTVVGKGRLFFDRYRAVNGYYIYGERRRPFGVENFPGEMARFDERVEQLDDEVRQLSQPPADLDWRLVEGR